MLGPIGQLLNRQTPQPAAKRGAAGPKPGDKPTTAPDTLVTSHVTTGEAPPVAREFRGAWIATVQNIDWPSRPGLAADQQKAELVAMLDKAKSLGLNAVVLQVRPNADSFYASPYEPYGPELTGKMGGDPGYDPLAFAVDEAHKRGLELHAWFNPFRAGKVGDAVSPDHVTRAHPEWVKQYGPNLWLDPANPQVQGYVQQVLLDVVKRYDIDAVHMDDYFYPYRVTQNGKPLDFPDKAEYDAYKASGGTLSQADWRRENINEFVYGLDNLIHTAKPSLKFGISPFGIWQPGNPPGIKGMNAYEELYADSRQWLQKGWVDYLAPQLYWPLEKPAQSFSALINWWAQQNPLKRNVYAGMATSNIGNNATWTAGEITRQIDATRETPGANGDIHFSMTPLMTDAGGIDEALARSYAAPALPPASPWLDGQAPDAPTASFATNPTTGARAVTWQPANEQDVFQWVVYARKNGSWTNAIYPASKRALLLGTDAPDALEIAAVDRSGNESQRARLDLPATSAAAPRGSAARG